MLEAAVDKINKEINSNQNNSYISAIGEFLIDYIQAHEEAADKILIHDNTIKNSLESVKNKVRSKSFGGCAVIEDKDVFKMVLAYYGITGAAIDINDHTMAERGPKPEPAPSLNLNLEELL